MSKFLNKPTDIAQKCANIAAKIRKLKKQQHLKFVDIADDLTDEVIISLSHVFTPILSLSNIGKVLDYDQEYCSKIFTLRQNLSERTLMQLYLESAHRHCWEIEAKKQLKNSDFSVCKLHTVPTWRFVRTVQIDNGVRQALCNDSVAEFEIYRTMSAQRISFSFLYEIFRLRAGNILGYMLKENLIPDSIISSDELVAYIICYCHRQEVVPLLKGIAAYLPGYLENLTDIFGRNLLWYTLFQYRGYSPDPHDPSADYLLSIGCDPDNTNELGGTWRYLQDNAFCNITINQRQTDHHEIMKNIIGTWSGCMVPGDRINLAKVKKYSRPDDEQPLHLEAAFMLRKNLRALFWDCEFMPEALLPPIWRNEISGSGKLITDEKLSQTARKVAQSYLNSSCDQVFAGAGRLQHIPIIQNSGQGKLDPSFEAAVEIMKTGLLMYNPLVRQYWIEQRYPHADTIRFIGNHECGEINDAAIKKAVENDDYNEFARLQKNACACEWTVIDTVFRNGKTAITSYLLDSKQNILAKYPLDTLVFYAVGQLDDIQGIKLLQALEYRWPESIMKSKDAFGSNALFHTIFNRKINWFSKDCQIVQFLVQAGCKRQDKNNFGIAFADVLQSLSEDDIVWRREYMDLRTNGLQKKFAILQNRNNI